MSLILIKNLAFYTKQPDSNGVYHAFPFEKGSTSEETAKKWATNKSYWNKQGSEPIYFEFTENKFDTVQIVSLDVRGNGGRAYQVLIHHEDKKFQCDLREDVLMEVILTKGINVGGYLNGSFSFIRNNAQTNLVLHDSDTYNRAKEELERREGNKDKKKISAKDLKVGHKYRQLNGSEGIYLGSFYAPHVDREGEVYEKPKKHHLFFTGSDNSDRSYYWYYDLFSSHNYYFDEGQVCDESQVAQLIERARESYIKESERNRTSYQNIKYGTHSWYSNRSDEYKAVSRRYY